MSVCPRTQLGIQTLALSRDYSEAEATDEQLEQDEEDNERAWNVSSALHPDALNLLQRAPRLTVNHIRFLPSSVVVNLPALGEGSFGAAYRCVVSEQYEWVVKVPYGISPVVALSDGELVLPSTLDLSCRWCGSKRTFDDFRKEAEVAEFLTEPHAYVQQLLHERRHDTPVHFTRDRVRELHAEMAAIRAHPGYAHIHKLVHLEVVQSWKTPYPMIFSEPCDGTLQAYVRASYPFSDTNAPAWRTMLRQLIAAVEFMYWRGFVHLDIHPGNIFLVAPPPGEPIFCKLADFGICAKQDAVLSRKRGMEAFQPVFGQNRQTFESPECPAWTWSAGMLAMTMMGVLGDNFRQQTAFANYIARITMDGPASTYYLSFILPSEPFKEPLLRLATVCQHDVGVVAGDLRALSESARLAPESKKRRFLFGDDPDDASGASYAS